MKRFLTNVDCRLKSSITDILLSYIAEMVYINMPPRVVILSLLLSWEWMLPACYLLNMPMALYTNMLLKN